MAQIAVAYSNTQTYAKHQKSSCGCGESTCSTCSPEDCECCPPGLVRVNDENGNFGGCLTPNDAEIYNDANIRCGEGFVKLFDANNDFLGCVTVADAIAYQDAQ